MNRNRYWESSKYPKKKNNYHSRNMKTDVFKELNNENNNVFHDYNDLMQNKISEIIDFNKFGDFTDVLKRLSEDFSDSVSTSFLDMDLTFFPSLKKISEELDDYNKLQSNIQSSFNTILDIIQETKDNLSQDEFSTFSHDLYQDSFRNSDVFPSSESIIESPKKSYKIEDDYFEKVSTVFNSLNGDSELITDSIINLLAENQGQTTFALVTLFNRKYKDNKQDLITFLDVISNIPRWNFHETIEVCITSSFSYHDDLINIKAINCLDIWQDVSGLEIIKNTKFYGEDIRGYAEEVYERLMDFKFDDLY